MASSRTTPFLSWLFVFVLFVLFGTSPSLAAPALKNDLQLHLKQMGKIRMCVDPNWMPYERIDAQGRHVGMAADYMRLFEQRLRTPIELVPTSSWQQSLNYSREGKCDILSLLNESPQRRQWLNFTSPYLRSPVVMVVKRNRQDGLQDIAHMKGLKLGIAKGYIFEETIKPYHPDIVHVSTSTVDEGLAMVSNGQLDGSLASLYVAAQRIRQLGLANLIIGKVAGPPMSLRVGVRKGQPKLLAALQAVVDGLHQEDHIRIRSKWHPVGGESNMEGARQVLTGQQQAYLRDKGGVSYCVDPNWMPYERIDEAGYHVGMSADYMALMSRRLGVPFRLVASQSWSDTLRMTRLGQCDIITMVHKTKPRISYLNFTEPYVSTPVVLTTRSDVAFLSGLNDVEDAEVGVPTGFATHDMIRHDYPWVRIRDVEHVQQGLQKVSRGELFALVSALPVAHYGIMRGQLDNLKISGHTRYTLDLRVGVQKQEPLLHEIMQQVVRSITPEEHIQIRQKWGGNPQVTQMDYQLMIQVGVGMLIVFMLIMAWNRKLTLLTRQLKQANLQAQQASETKSLFLANMSHEVRTPLNAIIGMSRLAQDFNEEHVRQDYMVKIHGASQALLAIINDLLDFSKLEAGKLELELTPFQIDDVIANINTILGHKAVQKGLTLRYTVDQEVPEYLLGDPLRLGQVLINLVSNSVKFTDQGHIIIRVEKVAVKDKAVRLRFSVKDTGVGISQAGVEGLFEAFTQADNSITRRFGGTGLGLAISRELVSVMGGEIEVESELSVGSRFYFEADFQAMEMELSSPVQPVWHGQLAVIVDADSEEQNYLVRILERLGLQTRTFYDPTPLLGDNFSQLDPAPRYLFIREEVLSLSALGHLSDHLRHHSADTEMKQILLCRRQHGVARQTREALMMDELLLEPLHSQQIRRMLNQLEGEQVGPRCLSEEGVIAERLRRIHHAKVLLVEDNPLNQQVAVAFVEQAGMEVSVAENGMRALEMVQQSPYDLVLMDIQMPIMDGLEATRQLRQLPGLKQLPVVAMTAHAMPGERERSLEAGMNDHLTKPVSPEAIQQLLIRWIEPKHPARVGTKIVSAKAVATPPPKVSIVAPDKGTEEQVDPDFTATFAGLSQLDTLVGLNRTGGNAKLYQQLLEGFLERYQDAPIKLELLVDKKDWNGIGDLAHTIKGVASYMAAEALVRAAQGMDQVIKQQQTHSYQDAVKTLQQQLQLVLVELQAWHEHMQREDTASP
ncbi:transporter substrate-binding domain-containing protein [Magnetococcus sp. PR-3]|uniref:transporter substrate-binding domain-containing protein n=1 Tax=Magnetococcus sp. PR-3 TaxID=3120355 RepID=UPI002FCE01EE